MTGPEVAETLRAAAVVLRERAAKATPGPWELDPDMISVLVRTPQDADGGWLSIARDATWEDGMWIATVHPGVGEPLAAWLDYQADRYECMGGSPAVSAPSEFALAVARVILGQAGEPS